MGDQLEKLKKQSVGNPDRFPDDDFVLFLDENLHKCVPILNALFESGVKCELHQNHFSGGEVDQVWLPFVCNKQWILLTKDKGIRYNQLEVRAILENNGREFYFKSGNWNGSQMGEILRKAIPKMRRMAKKTPAPFIASLTSTGDVNLRYDREGSIHDRERQRKTKAE